MMKTVRGRRRATECTKEAGAEKEKEKEKRRSAKKRTPAVKVEMESSQLQPITASR